MNHKTYFRTLLPLLVILSMLLTAVHTTPVYAQSEEPPATEPAATESGEDEPAGGESPATEPAEGEPAGSEQPPTEPAAGEAPATEPPLTEPAGSEPPAAETTESELPAADNGEAVAQAVEALAENELVLVDAQGEALPLASQEAAQTLAAPDPYFYHTSCAGGKCSYTTISQALTDFATKSATGFIYLEGAVGGSGGVYAETLNIDGSTAGYGGLTGLLWRDAEGKDVAGEASPLINGSVTIANFTHNFDLYGLRINGNLSIDNIQGNVGLNTVYTNGGIDITDSTGNVNLLWSGASNSTNDGINIENHTGNVTMYRVSAEGNDGYGARIDATGTVKISNSTFDYNGMDSVANDGGLFVTNSAAVSLVGVSASQNLGNGAYFDEVNAGLTVRNSIFNNNADGTLDQGFGLWAGNATNKGNLTFETVLANGNDQGNWTLQTNGNIVLNTVEGNGSQTGYGASLQTLGTGTVSITAADFNNNSHSANGYGFSIISNGNVTLDGAFAMSNGLYGAQIDNDALPGKTVTVLSGGFGNNAGGDGLRIDSSGMITLNGVSSWENSGYGMRLSNTAGTAGVSLLNTLGGNNANNNRTGGLYIRSKGALLLNSLGVFGNKNYGADLDNCLVSGSTCTGTGTVTINQSDFNGTWSTAGAVPANASGLWVQSKGLITLNGVSVSDSQNGSGTVGVAGAQLYNDFAGATAGVSILNTLGGNRFSQNKGGVGLLVRSNGLVNINSLDADNNSGDGVNINNSGGTTGVSLPGTGNTWSYLNDNGGNGLVINTRGAVTLNKIEAMRNSTGGAGIDNDGGTAGVTISSGRFNENSGGDGLNVSSKGAIKLTDIQANNNVGRGAALDNQLGTAGVTITANPNSNNTFNENSGHGLFIRSKGIVLVNDIDAGKNSGNGVNIDTCIAGATDCTAKGNVTLANAAGRWSWFGENTGDGLNINAGGNIAITRADANNNGSTNASLTANGLGTVSIQQGNFNQGTDGLFVTAGGMVTLNNIQVNENDRYGATLASFNNITLGGSGFNNNDSIGLGIDTAGMVTLTGITVENNGQGASIESTNNVTITNSSFARNQIEAGLWVKTSGTITLNQVRASENGVLSNDNPDDPNSIWAYGAMLDNSSSATAKTVTVNRGWFSNNYGDGLVVRSKGNVLLDGINANNNYSYHKDGVNVYHNGVAVSTDGTLTMSNKLGNNNLNNNSSNGLSATAAGKITLTNVNASDNRNGFTLVSQSDVLLTNLQGYNSSLAGLTVTTAGMVNLSKSSFSNNGDYNALIDNRGAADPAPKNVTITGSSFNNSSGGYGLQVLSDGLITLTSVTAYGNQNGSGAILDNTSGATAGVIVNAPKAYTYFGNNSSSGLQINTHGAVTLTNLRTDRNTGSGLVVDTDATVTITNLLAIQNGVHGADLMAGGIVTITKMSAFENGRDGTSNNGTGYGLKVTTSNDNVTVRNSAFSGNGEYGVWANVGAANFLDFYATAWVGNNRDGNTGNLFISSGSWRIFTLATP